MITDERLKELITYHNVDIESEWKPTADETRKIFRDICDSISELLSLRQQNKDLIRMGRGMRFELCFDDCSPSHIKTLLDDWDALMDTIDKEE